MPTVRFSIYSESSIVENQPQGQRTIIQGPLLGLAPNHIPGQFSFAFSVGVSGIDVINEDHSLRYIFKNPENNIIVDTGEMPIPKPTGQKIGIHPEIRGATLTIDVRNLELTAEGQYESEVYFDGIALGHFPVQVRKTIDQGMSS